MNSFLNTTVNTDLASGIIGCVQSAMYADGDANDVEIDRMANLLTGRSVFDGISIIDLYKSNINKRIAFGGDYLFEKSAELVTEEWKATTYAICCEILLSDTNVKAEEKQFLKNLQMKLGLQDEIVNKIIDVTLILHKGRIKG